jgi:ADP-ribose pyrophosphatase
MQEKTISSTTLYQGSFLEFLEEIIEIQSHEGEMIRAKRQFFKHPGGVCIVPQLDNGDLIMVKQFRTSVKEALLEFPAGKKDLGEDSLSTAKRELEEETGYLASEWIDLGPIYPAPGYTNERLDLFFARNLKLGKASPDFGEILQVFKLTENEIEKQISEGLLRDAKTICAWHLSKSLRKGSSKI